MTQLRFTSADLAAFPDTDGKRYEVIDGELYVSRQPDWKHQLISGWLFFPLHRWDLETGAGVTNQAPGIIFAEDDDVAPDLVWVSSDRLPAVLGSDGKLHGAPDLVVEILSPGRSNEQRDRETKLKLYSRRGVREYWIVDWQRRQIECYRHREGTLYLAATWIEGDTIGSPLLPGFAYPVAELFARLPTDAPVGEE